MQNFSDNALTVLAERYLIRDENDQIIETPEQLFHRVASSIALAEKSFGNDPDYYTQVFYDMMVNKQFLPNSPTIRNAGRTGTLSGCFVIPVEDSMEGICEARRQACQVVKHGGGVGYDFSALRPRGNMIQSTHRGACGPIAVMKDFDMVSETFTQGAGSFRKGAQMMMLRIDHPDIMQFIHAKDDGVSLLNANISVVVTDHFIYCLQNGEMFDLHWSGEWYTNIDPHELWNEIAASAWKTGDPGLWFIDRANKDNPLAHLGPIVATNPCGEQALGPYESCNLGSINLTQFVDAGGPYFNWPQLARCTEDAVRFLDDVVEVNQMPTPETDVANKATRRIGLGVMGWADALMMLRIPYASEDACALGSRVQAFVSHIAEAASARLANDRGVYGAHKGSGHEFDGRDMRNAFRTTVAPTGTLSVLADCSSGIEPIYAREYARTMEGGTRLEYVHPQYDCWRTLAEPGEEMPVYFATAPEIAPEWHVKMQAAFQRYVDNSISKTINMPNSATVDDVLDAYDLALESGCKGITIYRDGCRSKQVLNAKDVVSDEDCPECGERLFYSEGCAHCVSCGLSKCEI